MMKSTNLKNRVISINNECILKNIFNTHDLIFKFKNCLNSNYFSKESDIQNKEGKHKEDYSYTKTWFQILEQSLQNFYKNSRSLTFGFVIFELEIFGIQKKKFFFNIKKTSELNPLFGLEPDNRVYFYQIST